MRYLLLLWGADRNGANPMTPEEVHRVANERLMQMMPQVLPSPDAMGPSYLNRQRGSLSRLRSNRRQEMQLLRLLRPHSLLLIALHKGLRRRKVVLNRLRVRREGNSGELS